MLYIKVNSKSQEISLQGKNLFYIFNFVSVGDDIHEPYDNHFMVY